MPLREISRPNKKSMARAAGARRPRGAGPGLRPAALHGPPIAASRRSRQALRLLEDAGSPRALSLWNPRPALIPGLAPEEALRDALVHTERLDLVEVPRKKRRALV